MTCRYSLFAVCCETDSAVLPRQFLCEYGEPPNVAMLSLLPHALG